MNEVRSSVWLRFLIVESSTQLRQQPTRVLPNGAMAYIPSAQSTYRLVKGVGTTFDTLSSVLLIPGDQSDNRWFRVDTGGASPWSAVAVETSQNNIAAAGSNVWAALGTAAGDFTLQNGDSAMFAVNATSSLITYHGLSRDVLITSTVSVLTVAADVIRGVVSHNNDVAAGSSADQRAKGEQSANTQDGASVNITMQRAVTLVDGATLRQMLRSQNGAQEMQVNYWTMSIVPM